jgi:PAS domain S-box-containing protein
LERALKKGLKVRSGAMLRILWTGVWLIAVALPMRAAQLPVKSYTTADGLGSSYVSSLMRDSHGFIWFCTRDGLSRFDGSRFVTYQVGDKNAPPGIEQILETKKGIYWIVTTGGLYRFDPSHPTSNRVQNPDRPRLDLRLTISTRGVLYEGLNGELWLGGEKLYRLEEMDGKASLREVELHLPVETPAGLNIGGMYEGRDGSLWISTGLGLVRRLPDGREVFYGRAAPVNSSAARSVIEDRAGRIWSGWTSEVFVIKPEPIEAIAQSDRVSVHQMDVLAQAESYTNPQPRLPEKPGEIIRYGKGSYLYQTSDGHIWITNGNGVIEYDGQVFHPYTPAEGLLEGTGTMVEDATGNLWFGFPTGVMRLDRRGITTYGISDGLKDLSIRAVRESPDGTLYVGGDNFYLSRFDGTGFQTLRPPLPPEARILWTSPGVFQDHMGQWWFLTNKQLYHFAASKEFSALAGQRPLAVYGSRDGLKGDQMFHIFEDSKGDIWVSTHGPGNALNGLSRWSRATEKFYTFSTAEGLPPEKSAAAFAEDRQGNLWIGFYQGGLARYSQGRFTEFTTADGLQAGFISALHTDLRGRLWVASAIAGLTRIDDTGNERPHFVSYTVEQGLASNNIRCLTEDLSGNIYAGTARGVDKISPDASSIRHYSVMDGLAADFVYTAFRDRTGALWFGTPSGLSRMMPERDAPLLAPTVRLGGLRVAGESRVVPELGAAEIAGLELAHTQNNLQIDFFGINTGAGASLRYQYILEGADRDWSAPTVQHTINYSNLQPGSYIFKVRAINADGLVSAKPARLIFKILPPFWKRWWFVTIAALFISLVVISIERYRAARMRQLNAALSESKELTGKLTAQRAELYQANRTLELEYEVTRILAEAETRGRAAPMILQVICDATGWDVGAIWRVDNVANLLRCAAVWHQPTVDARSFESMTRKFVFLPEEGLPGRVWMSRKPIWISSLAEDTNFPRWSAAAAEGLKSAFAFPVLLEGEVLGVIEFFSRQPRERDEALIEMLATIGIQIGQLIERKQSEEALRTSEERFRTVIEQSPLSTQIFSPEGLTTAANHAYEKLWGVKRAEILGWNILEDEQLKEAGVMDHIRRGFKGEILKIPPILYDTSRTLLPWTSRGNPVRWIQAFIYPVMDEAESVREVVLVHEDITERKAAEDALRESENRFRTLAETASDAIITIDEHSTIIFVNEATERTFGYSQQEMIGADMTMLMPEYLRHLHQAGFGRYIKTGRKHISWEGVELPGLHRKGHEIPLEVSFGEFERHGRRFFTGIARDISERKRAEEALRGAREERLRELERVRKRIATDLHDDIGSSLTQISILSEVVQQQIGQDDSPVTKPLAMIANASRELVDSISDIVWAINPQKDHLSDLTQRMRRFASDVFTARNIEFSFRAPAGDDVQLGANVRRELFLIFKETVNNMVKHSGCTEASVEFRIAEGELLLKLSDNGKGFDTARDSDGHGLMSMRDRTRGLGGRLEIVSGPEQGTCTTLRVPLSHNGQPAEPTV